MQHAFFTPMRENFPGAEPFEVILDRACSLLSEMGFSKDSCIPNVAMCRDELCTHFVPLVTEKLGEPFGMRGLAGVLSCGQTGFGASNAHSPICPENRRRYVYIHATHIGINEDGEFGKCGRAGITHETTACGALMALRDELLKGGKFSTTMNLDDVEMCTLRALLAPHLEEVDETPNIVELTKLVGTVVVEEQLKKFIAATVDTDSADYAIISGCQIHAPDGVTYFCPSSENCFAVVDGKRSPIHAMRQFNFA